MPQSDWDSEKMLDLYIYDYMLKRNLQSSARVFLIERKFATDTEVVDVPGGFLFEWWSVFWDIYITGTSGKGSDFAAAYIEMQQFKAREQQELRMRRQMAQLQQMDMYHPRLDPVNSEGVSGQESPSVIDHNRKCMEHFNQFYPGTFTGLMDANRMELPGSTFNHQGQMMQGNFGSMSESLQQMQGRAHLASNSLPMDPSSVYEQNCFQSKSELSSTGLSGVTGLPLKDFPLTGIDQLCPSMGLHVPQPNLQIQNQFLMSSQQQQFLAQTQAQGNLGNSANYGFRRSPMGNFSTKDGQPPRKDGSICSTTQSNSPKYDLETFGDAGFLEDNVDDVLLPDGGEGFSLGEVGCIRAENILTCCHFSSDGQFLAIGGHDNKAVLWNMNTLAIDHTLERHQDMITDVRFRPESTQLATSSVDKSVRLWDAANPGYCLDSYTGHPSPIMSLDFHPIRNDLFCFCDGSNEVHYWSVKPFSRSRVSKQRGRAYVRFQPSNGHLLAAAMDNVVSIYDVENDKQTHCLQGHNGVVGYLCWDLNGDRLASVSKERIKIWSVGSGECIRELINADGEKTHCCIFHQVHSDVLVMGGLRSMELWNMRENKMMGMPAHGDIVGALAQSAQTGTIASAGHGGLVKVWR